MKRAAAVALLALSLLAGSGAVSSASEVGFRPFFARQEFVRPFAFRDPFFRPAFNPFFRPAFNPFFGPAFVKPFFFPFEVDEFEFDD